MKPSDEVAVLDILNAASSVSEFIRGFDEKTFSNDAKTQSAVLHQLLIMGEAAKRLSEKFRAQHPQIPLKMMAGMRDKLIHGYDDVDLDEVWKTASTDIPDLIAAVEPLAPRRGTSDG